MSVLFTRRGTPPAGGGSGGGVSGTLASDLEVGSSVYLNVNGTLKEFLIVHQGKPSSMYDDSCDGTWLLMKDVYSTAYWDDDSNSYGQSTSSSYLNNDFFNKIDAAVRSQIKQVKIPYVTSTGNYGTVGSGYNGLSTKVFLLSGYELGVSNSNGYTVSKDGAVLSYFEGSGNTEANRIAYMNGIATEWWLRSVWTSVDEAFSVSTSGVLTKIPVFNNRGIRPAFIIPYHIIFDSKTMEFIGVGEDTTTVYTVNITGSMHSSLGYVTINGQKITSNGIHTYTSKPSVSVYVGYEYSGDNSLCKVTLNGATVKSNSGTYNLTTEDTTIDISFSRARGSDNSDYYMAAITTH